MDLESLWFWFGVNRYRCNNHIMYHRRLMHFRTQRPWTSIIWFQNLHNASVGFSPSLDFLRSSVEMGQDRQTDGQTDA